MHYTLFHWFFAPTYVSAYLYKGKKSVTESVMHLLDWNKIN
jgi:hypothetical protein